MSKNTINFHEVLHILSAINFVNSQKNKKSDHRWTFSYGKYGCELSAVNRNRAIAAGQCWGMRRFDRLRDRLYYEAMQLRREIGEIA